MQFAECLSDVVSANFNRTHVNCRSLSSRQAEKESAERAEREQIMEREDHKEFINGPHSVLESVSETYIRFDLRDELGRRCAVQPIE
jgi:hypothetical protein